MPNWTYNKVTIENCTKDEFVNKFCKKEKGEIMIDKDKVSRVNVRTLPEAYFTNMKGFGSFGDDVDPEDIEDRVAFGTGAKDEKFVFDMPNEDERYKLDNLRFIIGDELMTKKIWTGEDQIKVNEKLVEWGGKGVNPLNWYSWNCAVLGTKWEFEIENIEEDAGNLTFSTNTAWSAPEDAFELISEVFYDKLITMVSEFEGEEWHHGKGCKGKDGEAQCEWMLDNEHGCEPMVASYEFKDGVKIKDEWVKASEA